MTAVTTEKRGQKAGTDRGQDRGQDRGKDRGMVCERCGTAFTCTTGGPCWCSGEDFKLPLTTEGGPADCLCPACLRLYAMELKAKGLGPKGA